MLVATTETEIGKSAFRTSLIFERAIRGTLVERQNGEKGIVVKKSSDGALHVTEIRIDKGRSLILAES